MYIRVFPPQNEHHRISIIRPLAKLKTARSIVRLCDDTRLLLPFPVTMMRNILLNHSRRIRLDVDGRCSLIFRGKSTVSDSLPESRMIVHREPVVPFPLSERKLVPAHIPRPPYAATGTVPYTDMEEIVLHDQASAAKMRQAAKLAANVLRKACALAKYPGITTDEIDTAVHNLIIAAGAYPSPLNYAGFPKSVCSSVNEIICHGIPDLRPLQFGDVVSFDVSCFLNGVHGDNCATVIVGDYCDDATDDGASSGTDWRGVPYRTHFGTAECEAHFIEARRLVQATIDTLYAAINTVKPGSCLTEIGAACQQVADAHGYASVTKYRGHGVSDVFHTAPFVKHYRNDDVLTLRPGMIFTIEPMLCQYSERCFEWEHDNWTVSTVDGGLAAQFEHTVLVTETGVEILTLPDEDDV
jgi:methionyl aminopeptidase